MPRDPSAAAQSHNPASQLSAQQWFIRARALARMQATVPSDCLRLVGNSCPDPLDLTQSKREWEGRCRRYRQRCRVSPSALAFLEYGIALSDPAALLLLEQDYERAQRAIAGTEGPPLSLSSTWASGHTGPPGVPGPYRPPMLVRVAGSLESSVLR
eukprot:16430212-Heterocapsa_arctica.AAC.5